MDEQEEELLGKEMELLMAERSCLLKVAGAAAVLIANTDVGQLPAETVDAAERVSECLNALPEETLKDALEAVQAHS